jgi:SAM-dependent methyltransferase
MSLPATLRRAVPRPIKAAVRRALWGAAVIKREARFTFLDLRDALTGRRRRLTPPHRLWGLVTDPNADFHAAGDEFVRLLTAHGLQPNHRVLDVGCGIGRLAIPLTERLSDEGGFDGFDIIPVAIRWCQRNITPRFPNFRFLLADVHSDRYHPAGRHPASSYRFPYEDDRFDYVFLSSVFTHMFPADLANYLKEIARVLRPGGQCLISYYLLNPERHAAIAEGGSVWTFSHVGEGFRAEYPHLPEAAIAFEEAELFDLYKRLGLEVTEVGYGVWARSSIQDQDLIVARKPS